MAIPESQLETWSKQGSVSQSASTYGSIKGVLEDKNAPFSGRRISIFLQGSYGNDTNVYGVESDVDIVCRLEDTFKYDLSGLNEAAAANFNATYPDVSYGYPQFRADVTAWLKKVYDSDATPGSKTIKIAANGGRRKADVLPCISYRNYWGSSNGIDGNFHQGLYFVQSRDNQSITNYPEQHSANCTKKHKETNSYFKPTVRILKNMRNRAVANGNLASGVAPSYFIEGMLWNVPSGSFGGSYSDTFVEAINWLLKADKKQLSCANDIHWLIRDGIPVCWNGADFDAYMAAIVKLWNEWS